MLLSSPYDFFAFGPRVALAAALSIPETTQVMYVVLHTTSTITNTPTHKQPAARHPPAGARGRPPPP